MDGAGDRFQQETKYHRERMSGKRLDWGSMPEIYKEYPESRKTRLPDPVLSQNMSLDQTLRMRKSIRHFSSEPMTQEQLSYLLWASTGIQRVERGLEFRPVPSAGALYPIETYLTVNNEEGLTQGVYHHSIRGHLLDELKLGDYSEETARAALGQRMCATAAVVFIWAAAFNRSKWKYEQRAYRYIYLDAGHMAQNLALATVSQELGSCQIAALYDDEANNMVGVDGTEESVIYMTAVGQLR